jgi:beta-lactamase regulating signal transducer with metallopeptidase domain
MVKNRSKLIFISGMLLSGLLFIQMAMYLLHTMVGGDMKFNVIQLCHTMIRSLGLTWVGYILNAVVAHTFILTIWLIGRQLWHSHHFYKKLFTRRHTMLTTEMNQLYGESGPDAILVIRHSIPMAFVMGLWKPRIIISTEMISMLSASELEAVLHHEWYHKKHNDPLKTFMLSLVASVMWYIPILKWCLRNYRMVREVLADHYAITKLGDPIDLGSALLKLLKGKVAPPMPVSHVSFSDTSINFRIKHILEPQAEIPLKWPFTPAMISIQVLLILCTMFVLMLH